jgi:hypothetical protein
LCISDDVDVDRLISRLAGPLPLAVRQAFRAEAEAMLAALPCLGEGAAWRALVPLQKRYFAPPPSDNRMAWDVLQERTRASGKSSKFIEAPPIERDKRRMGWGWRSRVAS